MASDFANYQQKRGTMQNKKIIITADDFGFSEAYNLGMIKAYKEGVVTTLNLMCNMPATQNAIDLWKKECPEAPLVAHVNYVQSRPISNPIDVPSLVDADGNFYRSSSWKSDDPKNTKCKGSIYPNEKDLYTECMAQLEKFKELTGSYPIHFDAHSIMTEPMIKAFGRIGKELGIHNPVSQKEDPDHYVMAYELPMKDQEGNSVLDRGSAIDDWLKDRCGILKDMHSIDVLHFHPGYVDKFILDHSSLTFPRCYDQDTLCSPYVKEWIEKHHIQLVSFKDIL